MGASRRGIDRLRTYLTLPGAAGNVRGEGVVTHGIRRNVSEAACKPSSVPTRLAARRGWPSI